MIKLSTIDYSRILAVLIICALPLTLFGQIGGEITTTENTNCNGAPCSYNGPSILINEIMMSPVDNDGSMWGGSATQKGEWIELYNPNICESIDISCYMLGNNADDPSPKSYPGGYIIPPGTVVPPGGFALIRGVNAAAVNPDLLVENGGNVVELVVNTANVCVADGKRLWFPNVGGWFAFYDANGVPQDAVTWGNQSNHAKYPCIPVVTGCGYSGTLSNYTDFPADRKTVILAGNAETVSGMSLRRIPDGGAWSGADIPTYATCNSVCVDPVIDNCTGTATAYPTGGTPPYTYQWNDSQSQNTQIADNLCAGNYCVTITDALNNSVVQCVTIEDIVYDVINHYDICEGETFTLPNGTVVSESGEYAEMYQTPFGCDSLVTTDLEVHPHYHIELNPEICANQTYTLPDGTEVSAAGVYESELQTIYGCDSIYTVNLSVNPLPFTTINAQICKGSTYELPDGSIVSEEGVYELIVSEDPSACDNSYKINLSFYPDFEIEITDLTNISCFGKSDGTATLTISGAATPYTLEWSDGVDHGSQPENLPEGLYQVEITDGNSCKTDTLFEIAEPQAVSITASADELICFGSGSNLLAETAGGTGAFTYHWSHTAENDAATTVNPSEDTEYSVYATDENGCETETILLEVDVIAMHPDSLTVSDAASFCLGSSFSLSASYAGDYPPYTYTWSHGLPAGEGPFTVSPESSTLYTVTVTDDCGNSVSKDIPVTVWSLPVANIDTIANISCFGNNDGYAGIAVNGGTPGYSFVWSDGQDRGAIGSDLPPSDYSIDVYDSHNCAVNLSFDIIEPALLTVALEGETLICFGSDITLLASSTGGTGNKSYYWGHTTSLDATSEVSPMEDTDYSVFVKDENGCETETAELHVDVINMYADSLEVADGASFCLGSSTSLSASYSGKYPPYVFTWSDGLPNGPGPYTVSPDITTDYMVTVSDDCGNTISKQIPVIVWELPVATVSALSHISCNGMNDGSAEIAVNGGTPNYTYMWSDGLDHGATGTGLIPADYSIDIYDSHGCAVNTSFVINEPEPLTVNLTGDTLICIGNETTLIAAATGGTGEITYRWSHTVSALGTTTASPQEDSQYTVYVTDENNCVSDQLAINVSVISMDEGLLSISDDNAICPEEFVSLSGLYSGNYPPYTYTWTGGLPVGAGPHNVSPEETTTFELTVTDRCDNALTANVNVVVHESPVAVLPDALLSGCSPLEINLKDSINTASGYSQQWLISNSETYTGNPVNFKLTSPGIYEITLVVTSPEGCTALSENGMPVEVFELPAANFNASPWSTGIDNPVIDFTDNSAGAVYTTWSIDNTIIYNQPTTAYAFPDTGRFAVELLAVNEFGCRDSIVKYITIEIDHSVDIPNAFTPSIPGDNPYYGANGNPNSVFYPFSDYVSDYQLSIFNRWGELIFESTEFEKGWNGTYRDEPCPQDVYVYKVEFVFTDGKKRTKVGDITLFR